MPLTWERPDYAFQLRGADGRQARVNDRVLERSFAVSPERLIEDWPVEDVASLGIEQLEPLLALEPEVVLLGSGARQTFPPARVMAACLQRGIGLETMSNDAAARTYNVLAGEGRRVVAGFVLGKG